MFLYPLLAAPEHEVALGAQVPGRGSSVFLVGLSADKASFCRGTCAPSAQVPKDKAANSSETFRRQGDRAVPLVPA